MGCCFYAIPHRYPVESLPKKSWKKWIPQKQKSRSVIRRDKRHSCRRTVRGLRRTQLTVVSTRSICVSSAGVIGLEFALKLQYSTVPVLPTFAERAFAARVASLRGIHESPPTNRPGCRWRQAATCCLASIFHIFFCAASSLISPLLVQRSNRSDLKDQEKRLKSI